MKARLHQPATARTRKGDAELDRLNTQQPAPIRFVAQATLKRVLRLLLGEEDSNLDARLTGMRSRFGERSPDVQRWAARPMDVEAEGVGESLRHIRVICSEGQAEKQFHAAIHSRVCAGSRQVHLRSDGVARKPRLTGRWHHRPGSS